MTQDPAGGFRVTDLRDCADPYALYATARTQGPVQRAGEGWLVFGHAEATELLRSSVARSGFIAEGYKARLPPGAAREEMSHRINFLDPPRHGRVRRLVARALTPRRTAALRPFVEGVAQKLLEPLTGDRPVDLLNAFAHEVPSLVISELLGVPIEERARLTRLSDQVSKLLGTGQSPSELALALSGAEEMHATLRALLASRRRQPEDDLMSALLAVDEDEDRLTESESLSLAATLYSAGHRTTRDLFSNGLAALLSNRDCVEALARGSLGVDAVVEEFLRFETPTHLVARMLAEPLELGGQTIAPGETLTVVLAAANRDPSAFEDPDRFDPWRWQREPSPPPVLSFAFGAHFCIGASLARLETATMLEVLIRTFPQLRLEGSPLAWQHTGLFRGLRALPVLLGPRGSS